MSLYIFCVSLVHLSWAQPNSSITALVDCPWQQRSMGYEFFFKISMLPQCDFRFDLFFSFSFRFCFKNIF